jgi:8-oxo-dGTP diphosphatase
MDGKWEFPGGKAETFNGKAESDTEALTREFNEEFGVPIRVGTYLAESFFVHKGQERNLRAYFITFDTSAVSLHDHSEWRWATVDEIRALGTEFVPSDGRLLPLIVPTLEEKFGRQVK